MNKWLYTLVGAVSALVLAGGALALSGVVLAEETAPAEAPFGRGFGSRFGAHFGPGRMGPGFGPGRMGPGPALAGHHAEAQAALAAKLNLSVEDLTAALKSGKTLADLAAEQGVTVEELQQVMADARNAAIDQLVQDGKLTAEQAERMKAAQPPTPGACGDAGGKGFGPGGHGKGHGFGPGRGFGRGPGGMWQQPDAGTVEG